MIFKKNKGFTLIEILIVITIIGLLLALALVGLGGAQQRARDTTRKSDLAQYRAAIQNFSGDNEGMFPGFTTEVYVTDTLCDSTEAGNVVAYLGGTGTCLKDPRDNGGCGSATSPLKYCYRSNSGDGNNASEYVLYTGLETGGVVAWWQVCSNGKSGKITTLPADSSCDVP